MPALRCAACACERGCGVATDFLHADWGYERNTTSGVPPVDDAAIERFTALLAACLSHAAARGFDLAVNVHADDGSQQGGWRNTLDFSPLERFRGYSFTDAVLLPITDALAAAVGPRTRAWLSLQVWVGGRGTVCSCGWCCWLLTRHSKLYPLVHARARWEPLSSSTLGSGWRPRTRCASARRRRALPCCPIASSWGWASTIQSSAAACS